MKVKIKDSTHTIYPGSTIHVLRGRQGESRYQYGNVTTKNGIVKVIQWPAIGDYKPVLSLDFIYKDQMHSRFITGHEYTDIGIARVANKFVREIVERSKSEAERIIDQTLATWKNNPIY